MAINAPTSAAEDTNVPTSRVENGIVLKKERSPLVESALSEAMMFCAVGDMKRGQRKIRFALNLSATTQDIITSEEIAYIMSGGTNSLPGQSVDAPVHQAEDTIPSDIQLVIAAVQRSLERKEQVEPISEQESQNLLERDLENVMQIIQLRIQLLNLSSFNFQKVA